jgi:hypothetical protein
MADVREGVNPTRSRRGRDRRGAGSKGRCALILVALGWALLLASQAQAINYQWQFDLSPDQVTPDGSGSSASGQAWLYYDTLTDHLRVVVSWTSLEADLTGLHIHGPALTGESSRTHLVDIIADETALLSMPSIVDRRTQVWESPTLHLFAAHGGNHGEGGVPVGIPSEDVLAAMLANDAYMLLHSDNSVFVGGELRGQLELTPVPEASTALLSGLGLCLLATRRARARG